MTSHLALQDRDQEDHPKYGPLAVPNTWSALQSFASGMTTNALVVGSGTHLANRLAHIRVPSGGKGVAGLIVDVNASSSPGPSDIQAISGRAVAKEAGVNNVHGLDFLTGASGFPANAIVGCLTRIFLQGTGAVVGDASFFKTGSLHIFSGSIQNSFGFRATAVIKGATRWPFSDEHAPLSNTQNRFRSNTQFFSLTPSFGAGLGVMGIANATTVPLGTPTGGGVFYASAGALFWRGSAGTVTLIAAA